MPAEGHSGRKRGARGGVKHQPGRDHDRKSAAAKKRRFARKAARRRKQRTEQAAREWSEWERLPDDVKCLLGPAGKPSDE
jgi:hypothetical protein